jgi:predicted NBD/HSP70 family sugar kinase
MPRGKKELPAYIEERINLEDLLASRRLLQLVHRLGPLTQREASEHLGLSQGTCNLHFQRLEHEGLLRSHRLESRRPGRPQYLYELDREQNAALGLAFDPPWLLARLEDFAGQGIRVVEADLGTCGDRASVEARLRETLREVLAGARDRALRFRQVFVAQPGVLEPATGAVVRAVNFPVLEGMDVAAIVQDACGVPAHANSLSAAYFYGEAPEIPGDRTALVLHWDLGLGFVFGRNRQILTVQGGDDSGRAISELGHISVDAGGPLCRCGQRGCLESYAGGAALMDRLGAGSLQELVRRAEAGAIDGEAEGAARLLGRHLAWPIQMMGVSVLRVTGALAPLFARGRGAFLEGLASVVGAERAAALQVGETFEARARLLEGASRAARRAFLYPEEFKRLSRISCTLQGERLGRTP